MLGVQLVADELEEPFGFDRDDLKLNRFCDVIRFQCFGILVPIFVNFLVTFSEHADRRDAEALCRS